ncbi:MAG: DUF4424 family protein [Alphaproteobacteria bacterium]
MSARGIALLSALLAAPAVANDTTAVLGAGGLVPTVAATVRIEDEELSVAPSEIVVRYRFRNTAAEPLSTIVAFPLPEIDLATLAETPINPGGHDPDDFVDFRVTVDGAPVRPAIEMRAWRHGSEVTEVLRRHGIPVSRFHPDQYPRLRAQPPAARVALRAAEIASWEDHDNVYPLWIMRAQYHWRQTFPAGRPLAVEHRYRPVVGDSAIGTYLLNESDEAQAWRARFCVDAATRETLRRMVAAAPADNPYRRLRTIAYVLTTARNWQGPIGRFRLTLDRERPEAILVTCFPGLAPDGPTGHSVERRDFLPDAELEVAIID